MNMRIDKGKFETALVDNYLTKYKICKDAKLNYSSFLITYNKGRTLRMETIRKIMNIFNSASPDTKYNVGDLFHVN